MAILIPKWTRYKKQKPVNPELDYGHELSRDLVSAHVFRTGIDITDNVEGTLKSTAKITNEGMEIVGVWGEAVSTADTFEIDNQGIYDAITNDEWTFFTRFRLLDLTSNYCPAGMGDPAANDLAFGPILQTSGALKFHTTTAAVFNPEATLATSVTRNTAEFVDVAIRYDGTDMTGTVNGIDGTPQTYLASYFPSVGSDPLTISSAFRSTFTNLMYAEDAVVEYTYFYNRHLEYGEIAEIQENPYQILRPGQEYWVMPVVAAGGPGTKLLLDSDLTDKLLLDSDLTDVLLLEAAAAGTGVVGPLLDGAMTDTLVNGGLVS